jgi:hypothetical protein
MISNFGPALIPSLFPVVTKQMRPSAVATGLACVETPLRRLTYTVFPVAGLRQVRMPG